MFPALLSAALAADPVSAVLSELEDGEGPGTLFVCAPLSAPLGLVGRLPLPQEMRMTMPEGVQYWFDLAEPGRAEAVGLDPDGALIMKGETSSEDGGRPRLDSEGASVSLSFSGDEAQADAFLTRLFPAEALSRHGAGWNARTDDGHRDIHLLDGRLEMSSGVVSMVPLSTVLLADLPDTPACLLHVSETGDELPGGGLLYLPLTGQRDPVRIRVATPEGFTPPPSAPPTLAPIHTTTAPLGVIVLSIEPLAMLSEPELIEQLAHDIEPEDIARLTERVHIPSGATFAVFGPIKENRWAAVVPVNTPSGKAMSVWKMRRGLKKSEEELTWTSRTEFTTEGDKGTVYGGLEKGLVRLAASEELRAEVASGEGEAWVTPEQAAHVADWPVSVRLGTPPGMPVPPMSVLIGAQVQPEYFELSVAIPEGLEKALPNLLGLLMMGQQMKSLEE